MSSSCSTRSKERPNRRTSTGNHQNNEGDQYQIGETDQIDGMTGTTVRTKGLVRGVGAQEGRMPHQFRFVQGPSLPLVGTEPSTQGAQRLLHIG